jgi:phosphatidylglycerophosphatase A
VPTNSSNLPPAHAWWQPAVIAASCCWVGRLWPAPGTWGSAFGLVAAAAVSASGLSWPLEAGFWLLVNLAGVPICSLAARQLGGLKDPSVVVLDEAAAMPLVLLAVAPEARTWLTLLAAFGLFRLFDITKLPPCRRLERLPEGLGIMADDWAAAAYAAAILAVVSPLLL